jgi:hypothetical protein
MRLTMVFLRFNICADIRALVRNISGIYSILDINGIVLHESVGRTRLVAIKILAKKHSRRVVKSRRNAHTRPRAVTRPMVSVTMDIRPVLGLDMYFFI